MIKIAICDDNITLCSEIEEHLLLYAHKYGFRIEIDIFYSGQGMINYMHQGESFDLVYLDIELGEMKGIQVAEVIRNELKNETTQIIYISANDSYALELFETRPMNFLIKPIAPEKMESVFLKACELLNTTEECFEYTMNQKQYRQPINKIIYFESLEKKVRMVVLDDEIMFYSRLKAVEEQVKSMGFISIHKSYIVNPNQIMKYEYTQLTMSDGSILPVSQSKRSTLRQYMFERRKGN